VLVHVNVIVVDESQIVHVNEHVHEHVNVHGCS